MSSILPLMGCMNVLIYGPSNQNVNIYFLNLMLFNSLWRSITLFLSLKFACCVCGNGNRYGCLLKRLILAFKVIVHPKTVPISYIYMYTFLSV